jgi:hypothetical protein
MQPRCVKFNKAQQLTCFKAFCTHYQEKDLQSGSIVQCCPWLLLLVALISASAADAKYNMAVMISRLFVCCCYLQSLAKWL